MSIRLPVVDITGAIVGTSNTVELPQPKVQIGELAHLRIFNESGCGLDILFSNNDNEFIPAGAWPVYELDPTIQTYTYTVKYVLPNAPVSQINAIYYFPGENVPSTPALGNSPIGITGSQAVVSTLSNEGNPAGTEIVDIGTAANSKLIDIFNDHMTWAVEQAGVKHQIFTGQTAGNPLQIGQTGDVTEFLSQPTFDDVLTMLQGFFITEHGKTSNIFNDASGFLNINNPTSIQLTIGGVGQMHIDGNGAGINRGSFFLLNGKWTGINILAVTAPTMTYPGTFTVTHNFGWVPDWAMYAVGQPGAAGPGSCTTGVWNCLANTCKVTLGAQINGVLVYAKN